MNSYKKTVLIFFFQSTKEKTEFGLTPSLSTGAQYYDVPNPEAKEIVWKPIPHAAAKSLASGEAVFIDDMPKYASMLTIVRGTLNLRRLGGHVYF